MALLAEFVNQIRQRPLVNLAESLGGRGPGRRIHPHVERIVLAEAEPPPRFVQLHRRPPEVHQQPVDRRHAALVEHRLKPPVVRVHDLDAAAEFAQRVPRRGHGRRIAIKPDQPRGAAREQRPRVAPEADSAVDKHPAARGLEVLEHFGDHDRLV